MPADVEEHGADPLLQRRRRLVTEGIHHEVESPLRLILAGRDLDTQLRGLRILLHNELPLGHDLLRSVLIGLLPGNV